MLLFGLTRPLAWAALVKDEIMSRQRISVEIDRTKNINKNPVAEKAIQELEDEILRQDPSCRALSTVLLSVTTTRLKSRIRNRRLLAREIWTQWDQTNISYLAPT